MKKAEKECGKLHYIGEYDPKEIMNKENDWDYMTKASVVEGSIEKVTCKQMVKAIKPGKAAGPSEVCAEIIFFSGEVGITVTMELCLRVLDGKRMLNEWQMSLLVPILKAKEDLRNCNVYRSVKL